ncbi:lysylphosphatidylglycerol synthase domain-containing protein [Pseudokineococcus marinus]|uniref:Phosphotransferase n=1 Tax=Pseudokineococcus marinus TaxID=351215 RepID=A0A849BN37_9ACTN|nr:lysylphosphatidylglycerol synthase domain-containing protein [Pseudokineococcus marinus]NNH22805.1 phosphotransferase [Pseudokineococcus marinus]
MGAPVETTGAHPARPAPPVTRTWRERALSRRSVLLYAGAAATVVLVLLATPALARLLPLLVAELGPAGWVVVAVAAVVLLLGHVLRAARTKTVVDNVRRESLVPHVQALAIGYLFDAVLPLRLGEVVRAVLVARSLRVSTLYTLAAVVVERLIDVVLVAGAFLAFVALVRGEDSPVVPLAALGVVLLSLGLLVLLTLVVLENGPLLRLVWRASSLLNSRLETRLRFKVWSVLFGLQRFVRQPAQLRRYALLTAASWGCYLLAAALVAVLLLPGAPLRDLVVATAAPYAVVSPSVAAGLPQQYVADVLEFVGPEGAATTAAVLVLAVATWLVLYGPVLVLGVVSLLVIRLRGPAGDRRPLPPAAEGFENKLRRDEDISGQLPSFLDAYFQRDALSRVLHRLEVAGDVTLVRFFKGGSNAVTVLAQQDGRLYVKKIVPPEHAHRLKNQHDWLAARRHLDLLVQVTGEESDEDHYAIDLEYRPASQPLFEWVHERSREEATAMLDRVWAFVSTEVYRLGPLGEHPQQRDDYVRERFVDRVRAAADQHEELGRAVAAERVVVNGRVLDGFDAVLRRIRADERAWHDLSVYRESTSIHGDLTVDNVLVDLETDRPLVIDPSDDNQVRGPVIDFARHMQSLHYGYEFLNEDTAPVGLGEEGGVPAISYRDHRSARYAELEDHVTTHVMTRYLSPAEQRSVLFHVGLFYGRMLTHRVVIDPGNALKYFAVSLQALNRFADQYELPLPGPAPVERPTPGRGGPERGGPDPRA